MSNIAKKQPRFFASFDDMADLQLAHGARLSMEDRLRELNRLNCIACATWQAEPPRPRRKRMTLYLQQPGETLAAFLTRTAQARLAWTSSLTNSAIL